MVADEGLHERLLHVIVLSIVLQIAAFAAPFQIQLVIDEAVFHADQDQLVVLAAPLSSFRRWKPCEAGRLGCSAIS